MGQYTIVIHGVGPHHNLKTARDPERGTTHIVGRENDFDADLLFAEFVDLLRAKGHNVTLATFTAGGMLGEQSVIRPDYVSPFLAARPPRPAGEPAAFDGDAKVEADASS